MENVIFAMGGQESYMFNAPKMWSRGNLPIEMENHFKNNNVKDIRLACLGTDPYTEYLFLYEKKDGTKMFCYGTGLPQALLDYCKKDGQWDKDENLHVVLGPNKSFIAWDRTSIRWSNIPPGLEAAFQSWLSPSGWTQGPPRIVALGKNGAYFAMSEYGSWSYLMPATTSPDAKASFDVLAKEDRIETIQCVFLNPAVDDCYVIVTNDTHAYGHGLASFENYNTVAASFASPEILAIYEAERKTRQEEVDAERKRKEAEEAAERKRKVREAAEIRAQQQKEDEAKRVLRVAYKKWKLDCETLFKGSGPIVDFPHLPIEVCTCDMPSCWSRKVEKLLFACRHDVEKLLRASDVYTLAWLRTERLKWHPDRFGLKCSHEMREALCGKATEMYTIYEELIAIEVGA